MSGDDIIMCPIYRSKAINVSNKIEHFCNGARATDANSVDFSVVEVKLLIVNTIISSAAAGLIGPRAHSRRRGTGPSEPALRYPNRN